jgi:tRNA/tmRNA/rRNA uracil-C5-methylase (TrmA/RlmC/RlmD family)
VRLQVDADGMPGPYAARSHRVISVDDIPLAVQEARAVLPFGERFHGATHVDVVAPSLGEPFVVVEEARTTRHRARSDRRRIVERVGDREFGLDARGFWQVHRHAAATLTRAVQDAVDPAAFDLHAANLDLYGGVGLLAAAVGDRFGDGMSITSVESDQTATEHAAENLAEWVGAKTVADRVDRFLRGIRMTAGPVERDRLSRATVVLDPPRSGAGREVVDQLAELAPTQIVYVACDPVALARDVGMLAAHGYRLSGLRAFDLFPNTHHVEAVASFRRD